MSLKRYLSIIACIVFACLQANAQDHVQPAPTARPQVAAPDKSPRATTAAVTPPATVVAQPAVVPQRNAPQVVTVVHRLSGIKLLRLLHRSNTQTSGVVELDQSFTATKGLHTSIIAGLTLGDGRSIVTWLPQAQAEVEAPVYWPGYTVTPAAPAALPPTPPAAPATAVSTPAPRAFPDPADLMIVRRNGQQVAAQYVGLDGLTGLSLLQVEGENLPPLREVKEETLAVGQRVRLLAPQRAELLKGQPVPGALYLRVGEIESRLSEIRRVSSGRISRLVVRAPRLSQAFVGGVALNDAGETIGIVEASNANEARIMPTAMVRRAAERILARRASVPRPLLGISGFAVNALTQSQIAAMGWTDVKAAGLLERAQGIMLTRVLPGTPAALAELRPGDVVVRVNEIDVKSTDDLSYLLSETVAGASLNFTLLRPAELNPQSVNVTLKDYSALVAREMAGTPAPSHLLVDPLMTLGAETLSLSPRAAARFGAQGGRLVVFVNPESAAAHSGLRAGDVIEALDDQMLTGGNFTFSFKFSETFSLGIVRNRQRLKITIRTK